MARKQRGLGRGLDALIPRREEIEKEFARISQSSSEVFFSEDFAEENPETEQPEMQQVKQQEKQLEKMGKESESEHQTRGLGKVEKEPEAEGKASGSGVKTVRISEIEPNRGQPRRYFDEEALQELADSIGKYGILQPILVQDRGDHYEIIAGERRWRAAMKAGVTEVPVIVRRDDEKKILEMSLIENIQRENLNPVEEAMAYRELMEEYGLTQEEVAGRISKSRSAVANILRLLKLDERVQKMLAEGSLTMGHARALVPLESGDEQYEIAVQIAENNLSVRDAEKLIRRMQNNALKKDGAEKNQAEKNQEGMDREEESLQLIYRNIEERLCQKLGTKVSIKDGKKGTGKLLIEFYSYEDLEKVIDKLS
ncbi:MAG: ParB/RepB/Spo0J family partition protein [Lachnospiraceae bacterium]|nr:ParB/RepB/Spo0J family partition protein [Lachnospiraceae bacterium]